ncbi:MAG: hypothetical protein LBK13_04540 [Spirochaetales bacterium]|nr:hypothetical protein [Spirochaetales bacterium]
MDKLLTLFPADEKKKRKDINLLMKEWKKEVSKSKRLFRGDGKLYSGHEYFVADGFFPNYYKQTPRILFIGREARYISGSDLIDIVLNLFKENKVQSVTFWRRILYMLYGIKHKGKKRFKNIPDANTIAAQMVESNNYGLAIMNISKYSNDCDDGAAADTELINGFLQDSHLNKRNYFKEELTLLEPDIIITANLWARKINYEYLDNIFGEKELINKYSNKANLFSINFNNKKIKIIDTYHFSGPGIKDEDYYLPVMRLLYNKT